MAKRRVGSIRKRSAGWRWTAEDCAERYGAGGGTGSASDAAVSLAEAGSDGAQRGREQESSPVREAAERDARTEAGAGGEDVWRWIFSKVPCKKSRLDARAAAALARRRLRPNPGGDADARQPEYRADVSAGAGEPGRVSIGRCRSRRQRKKSMEVRSADSADRAGASPALWLSAGHSGTAAARDAGESQAGVADHAGGQSAGRAAASVRGDHGFRSRAGGLSEPGQPHEADRHRSALGGRHHVHSAAGASSCTWR